MAYEMRSNTGNLFRNEKTHDKSPDYRGEALVNGVTYQIGAWIKEGKKGKFMSLAFTKKEPARD